MGAQRLTILALVGLVLAIMVTTTVRIRAAEPLAPLPPVPTVVILPDVVLNGPGIVQRDMSKLPPLVDSRMEVVQGTRAEDGTCRFQPTFSATHGDIRPQVARQIAFDPATCRFQIEWGTAPSAPPAPPAKATAEATRRK